jgi:Chaperone of endosialidase
MAFVTVPGVSDGELIRTSWGDAVADNINVELIRRNGAVAMTGLLTLDNVNPTSDNHAVRKKYVDDKFMLSTGGVITGVLDINAAAASEVLVLRSQVTGGGGAVVNTPQLAFYNNTEATRYGYLQGSASGLGLVAGTASIVLSAGNDITLAAADDIFLNPSGDTTVNGNAILLAAGAQHLTLRSTSGFILFQGAGSAEVMRIDSSGRLLVGKTASSVGTEGTELSDDGQMYSTVVTNVTNLQLNRGGTADVDGGVWIRFENNSSTVGSINWDTGTSKVVFSETSDYRLKNDLGPVVDGLDRINRLRPRRITRKDSSAPVEHDALIAHEVAEVMPSVVTGDKDAVAPPPVNEGDPAEGSIVPQQLNYTGLITVSIAAIQDLAAQVEALTARVAELEAAA